MRTDASRLAGLRRLLSLDSTPERADDDSTRLPASSLEVPIVLISMLDQGRDWHKSVLGLARQTEPQAQPVAARGVDRQAGFVHPPARSPAADQQPGNRVRLQHRSGPGGRSAAHSRHERTCTSGWGRQAGVNLTKGCAGSGAVQCAPEQVLARSDRHRCAAGAAQPLDFDTQWGIYSHPYPHHACGP